MPSTLSCECTARTLFSGNGILRYHEAGYGPPLVFLHGNGRGATGWAAVRDTVPAFAEFFRCLILELPGIDGDGGGPIRAGRDALARFIAALELESFGIVGDSVNGHTAADYALRHPGSVHRLVIIGGIDRNVPGSGNSTRWLPVQTPTLLVWGRDDRVTPLDMAIATVSGFPNAQLHVFPDCGHRPMTEQREAVENVVLSFLLQRDRPEYHSGTGGFISGAGNGSAMATAAGGGCTARPSMQYVMGQ